MIDNYNCLTNGVINVSRSAYLSSESNSHTSLIIVYIRPDYGEFRSIGHYRVADIRLIKQ